VYIINIFRMRLLKHSSIDINGVEHISLVKVDQDNIWIMVTDSLGKITTWRIKTNKRSMNLQTICSERDFEIDFELRKSIVLPDIHYPQYLLVYSEDILVKKRNNLCQIILTVSKKEINKIHLEAEIEDVVEILKFKDIGDIIFATTVQKNEGVYILLISETFDLYIDRLDQLEEDTAPLIQINLIECSEINNIRVSSSRLEKLLENRNLQYDDNSKMLYFLVHEEKKMISWFINDMLRNSRFYTYGNNQDIYKPESIPLQCSSIDIFSDQEASESEVFLHEGNSSLIGHNLISFNDIITEEFQNVNYYQFFYSDEKVTCTLIISAIEHIKKITPALVIGTNYGRIFIVSLFQISEGDINPIIIIDSHFGNQVNGLFFANNKYLFSISEEGTLCITKISSHIINDHFHQLKEYRASISPIQRKRFDRKIKGNFEHN